MSETVYSARIRQVEKPVDPIAKIDELESLLSSVDSSEADLIGCRATAIDLVLCNSWLISRWKEANFGSNNPNENARRDIEDKEWILDVVDKLGWSSSHFTETLERIFTEDGPISPRQLIERLITHHTDVPPGKRFQKIKEAGFSIELATPEEFARHGIVVEYV